MLVGYGMVDQKAQCWCWYEGNPWQGTPWCCQGPAQAEDQKLSMGGRKSQQLQKDEEPTRIFRKKKPKQVDFKQLHKLISPKGQPGSVLHLLLAFPLRQTWHKTHKIK